MKLKKALSTLLAAAMACGLLAAPASAAGTTETFQVDGGRLTVTNVVRTVTQSYQFNRYFDPNWGTYDTSERGDAVKEITIYVVGSGAEITYTPTPEGYYTTCTFEWNMEEQLFDGCGVTERLMEEPETTPYERAHVPWYGVPGYYSQGDDDNYFALRSFNDVFVTSEEELANFVPYGGAGAPEQPAGQQPSGWAKGLIDDALEQGMVTERTQGRYQDQITRLQFAELAANLIENITHKEITPAGNTFTDTDDIMVLKAVAAGVASGKGDGLFAPNDFITRQEICVMLSKVIQYVDAANGSATLANTSTQLDTARFSDTGDVASWARDAVALLTNNDLMSGSDGKVLPRNNTTVEQAIILIRALSYKI